MIPARGMAEASGAPIPIANAGLVLFSPYLPALFERLGLLTRAPDGAPVISGVEAQSRAVHLLQYLADGQCDAPDSGLALNKLLSGVSADQPIVAITPSSEDLAICDGLLHAVIANWAIIKNTSIEGLRETFLRREGRLHVGEGRWDLNVQRKGLDVLVDQIPWTFSLIHHRWMTNTGHVTW